MYGCTIHGPNDSVKMNPVKVVELDKDGQVIVESDLASGTSNRFCRSEWFEGRAKSPFTTSRVLF